MTLDELDPRSHAFLRGCLLGDGWLGLQRKQFVHLRIGHCAAQLPYLQWKAARINKILGIQRRILGPYNQGSGSSKGKPYPSYLYCVDNHELFAPWFYRWYDASGPRVIKKVTPSLLEGLGLEALAVLWCDDGTIHSSNRQKQHRLQDGSVSLYPYVEARGAICTCSFSEQENRLLIDWIDALTGVKFKMHKSRGYPRLSIGKRALRQFIPQLAPYVPECMSRKVDLSHCRAR